MGNIIFGIILIAAGTYFINLGRTQIQEKSKTEIIENQDKSKDEIIQNQNKSKEELKSEIQSTEKTILTDQTGNRNEVISEIKSSKNEILKGQEGIRNNRDDILVKQELVSISRFFQTKTTPGEYFDYFDYYKIIELNGKEIINDYRTAFFNNPPMLFWVDHKFKPNEYGRIDYCTVPKGRIRDKESWGNYKYCNQIVTRKYMDAVKELENMENSVLLDNEMKSLITDFRKQAKSNLRIINNNLTKYGKDKLPSFLPTNKNPHFDMNYGIGSKEGFERIKDLKPLGINILTQIKKKM